LYFNSLDRPVFHIIKKWYPYPCLGKSPSKARCWQRRRLRSSNSQSRSQGLKTVQFRLADKQIPGKRPHSILCLSPHPPPSNGGQR
uniref:Uncharacterized protein n=1 Tax=Rhinolophus ferrumequinum TaxID=59479 RepID=A0A671FVG1_RHIFE